MYTVDWTYGTLVFSRSFTSKAKALAFRNKLWAQEGFMTVVVREGA